MSLNHTERILQAEQECPLCITVVQCTVLGIWGNIFNLKTGLKITAGQRTMTGQNKQKLLW